SLKQARERPPLTLEQGQAILASCPDVKQIAITIFNRFQIHLIKYGRNQAQNIDFRGTFPAYMEVYGNAQLLAGRFFNEAENEHRSKVVVLGEDTAKALFPTPQDALQKTIAIDGSDFLVIGVFSKPPGGFGLNDQDIRVMIPYYTYQKMFPSVQDNGYRFLAVHGKVDEAVDEATEVLRRERKVHIARPTISPSPRRFSRRSSSTKSLAASPSCSSC